MKADEGCPDSAVMVSRSGTRLRLSLQEVVAQLGLPAHASRLEGGRKVGGFGIEAMGPLSNSEVLGIAFAQFRSRIVDQCQTTADA